MAENKKILIIEDNDLNQKLFKDLLEAHGHNTVSVCDGAGAIEMAEEELPDLVIMDIQLPNISGIDLIRTIKNNNKLKSIPIVAVTAYAMEEDKDKILATGCEEYVPKPISIEPFVKILEKYL